jgi:UTP-glucose-1-phosphate uridylyltransferase
MTIGIIPAAGKATRIHGLPKYLLPVPGGYLLERMAHRMGVPCVIGANPDNYDLINACKPPNSTVYSVNSRGMPETILAAREYAGDENVLVGMPDTYWTDETVFWYLTKFLNRGAVCVAAIFHVSAEMASRLGVCIFRFESSLFLNDIEDKQPQTEARWVWGALAWSPEFWQYIYPEDAHLGVALQRALRQGLEIPLWGADGDYYDNGTSEDYFRCIRELTTEVVA